MSLRADEANDRVSYTASPPPDPATALTVTFWARLRVDRDDFSTMMRLHASSGSSTRITVATSGSGTVPAIYSPGNTGGVVGTDALVVDQWRMIAVTVAGTGATDGRMYTRTVGGSTNVTTGQVSGGSTPDGITLFGRSASDSSEWFNGGLAHVRVWSAVLTQTEIEAEWNSATVVRTSNLWSAWSLATDLSDSSGNGRNLSAGLTALSVEDDPPIQATVTGSAALSGGALTSLASGTRTVSGSAALPVTLSATVNGSRSVDGAADMPGGGLTASAGSLRTVIASGAADFGSLTAAAGSPSSISGQALGDFGGMTAAATGSAPVTTPSSGGSWDALTSYYVEAYEYARTEREEVPVACWDCGEPLRLGPRGERYCPFDGQKWSAGYRRVYH